MKNDLYEKDYYLWINEQVNLLKNNNLNEIDLENVIEELESLGRNDLRALESQVERLIQHLLKWIFQPKRRTRSWKTTIINSRLEIEKMIDESGSLRNKIENSYGKCYIHGMKKAKGETDITIFPKESPWILDQILDENFWPEELNNEE